MSVSLRSLAISPGALAAWAGGTPEGAEDEKILKNAGVQTDGAGLLKYFRDRSPNEAEKARLAALVNNLGHISFRVRDKNARELTAIGEAALPFLKAALKHKDVELSRQAAACIRLIEQIPYAVRTGAAARLLALRRPEGAVDRLLDYLPFADWDAAGEDLLQALVVVGKEGDAKKSIAHPAILAAVRDKEPLRRLAAAHVLGHVIPAHSESLHLLVTDEDPQVRFHAAVALVRCRDNIGVLPLIAFLEKAPLTLAFQAEMALLRLAGEKAPSVTGKIEDPIVRRKWQTDWEGWWTANRDTIDLAKIKWDDTSLGLILVCEIDGIGQFPGRITALHRNGAQAWTIEGLDSPTDFQWLGGGRVLVSEHWAQRVTERDRKGDILRKWDFADKPVTCRRLPNGNTFVATYTEIVEFTPTGTKVYSHKHQGMIYCACPLPNQHVLFITSSGQVIELDKAGTQIRSFTPKSYADGAGYWASVEPLPNGRYLIGLAGNGKIVETDDTGKIYWESSVERGGSATALSNGNILAVSADGRFVIELHRQQGEMWRKTTKGRPFWARRY